MSDNLPGGSDAAEQALAGLGWTPWFTARLDPGEMAGRLGRVTSVRGLSCTLETAAGTVVAESGTALRRRSTSATALPAVGDWVEVTSDEPAQVLRVLPRRTALTRKVAGEVTEGQVMAANIDLVLVVASLAGEIRPRGIERYLTVAWESGAEPILVLTKADLGEDVEAVLEIVREVAPGVEVHPVSSVTGTGLEALQARLKPGLTAVIVGPSGAGKSTLINRLSGNDARRTGAVRGDLKGRHTTTHRELFLLPGGGLVIDTPGLRELQLWHADEGLGLAFSDIETLASGCRFSDCRHQEEPGCRVIEAIGLGTVSQARVDSYRALRSELELLAARAADRLQAQQRAASRRRPGGDRPGGPVTGGSK